MEYASLISLALLLGLAFLAYWLFRAEHGAFWRWRRTRQLTQRVLREDALKHLHRCERYGQRASVESLAGAIQISADESVDLLTQLQDHELVEIVNGGFAWTAKGRE